MKFAATEIAGAHLIELEELSDERGWFARTYNGAEFERHGIHFEVIQANTSFNEHAGTVRGMHFQEEPHGEPKLVRCTRGAIYDVIVDLRRDSESFLRSYGVELTPANARMLYLPTGVAHGFQTLEDGSEVSYLMGAEYVPDAARGVRWDDPAFAVDWPPAERRIISEKDLGYPDFDA